MTLTDVMSVEEWEALVREIQDKYGLDCSVSDPEGGHVTHAGKWCNDLCPEIKKCPEALGSICATAAQSFTAQAKQTRRSVVSECDAGMVKISVPIFSGDEFLGTIGGCGALFEDGEVEDFLVQKTTGMEEDKIEELISSVKTMPESKAEECAEFIESRLKELIK
ncbi:Ligand-binding sensor domain-containing protein [Desulfatibacillum alkenivorans DSM 16219]|jgi:ligand-binding sensor protein|uniref:Ligand-binding sensor domain-containing protein n=1 Tax=Desulfatibacillum alkenivorans DSM 16219 TaxID=1121393 RepID=A0A1M6SGG7_9BACT|nr:PocR ligand-binding domain-containing protein [Desulfatibacillum alkenivorans]SHK43776.1 Ligand-binding sensor domain-containing protein [Desulfatibacillum alkenivorans DSM 16219]